MKKILSLLLTGVLSITILAGCGNSPAQSTDTTPISNVESSVDQKEYSIDKVAFTYVKSPLNVPSIVEKEKGVFAKAFEPYGLDVEYSNLTTGPEQTQALASGDIQFLNAVGATSIILSAANGADIKIISMYSRSPEAFRLFTKNASITSAADLKGKKIAGPKGTILHELLITYLGTAGLTENDIEFFSMGIPESQAALAGGEVDCALLAGPTAYNMAKDGYSVVTTGKGLVDATIVTATSNQFYEENPELVKAFLDAQHEVLSYMESNYDEIIEITAKETELSDDAVKEMFPMYDFNSAITDGDIASMKKTAEFMLDNAMIEKAVDVNNLILKIN